MARRKISDELWQTLEPLLPVWQASVKGGRRRSVDDRSALNGILFVLQTGIPWEDLPKELGYGCGMTCWRRLRECDQIDWSRASLDAASIPRACYELKSKGLTG